MTSLDTTTAPETATLTERELFARFLDAPMHIKGSSTLVPSARCIQVTPRDYLLDYVEVDSVCLSSIWTGYDIPETILEQLEDTEQPLEEIEEAIGDLESILASFRVLKREFQMLADATIDRTPPEETGNEEADAEAYQVWEDNPRFILPVTEQKEAA